MTCWDLTEGGPWSLQLKRHLLSSAVLKLLSCSDLKGIVHPKMKILSSFTHPQVVPNLWMSLFCWTKEDILKNVGKEQSGAPLTSIVFFFLLWKSIVPQNSLVTNFLQNLPLCSQNKEFIQVWNYLRVSKWWHNFHFWVNYPFNL